MPVLGLISCKLSQIQTSMCVCPLTDECDSAIAGSPGIVSGASSSINIRMLVLEFVQLAADKLCRRSAVDARNAPCISSTYSNFCMQSVLKAFRMGHQRRV